MPSLHERRHRLHAVEAFERVDRLVVEKRGATAGGVARRGHIDLCQASHRLDIFPVSRLVAKTDRDEHDDAHHARLPSTGP